MKIRNYLLAAVAVAVAVAHGAAAESWIYQTPACETRNGAGYAVKVDGTDAPVSELQNCDYADIHDVLFEDIRIDLEERPQRQVISARAKDFNPAAVGSQPCTFGSTIHVIPEYSKEGARRVPFVALDICDQPGMKATGLFRHPGVAAHPSDRGMAEIARRLLKALFAKADET